MKMKISKLKERLLEGSYKKVKQHTVSGKSVVVLLESESGTEEFVITENEDETLNLESENVLHENATEEDIDQLFEANTKTKDSVTMKELAQIFTINNVKGRNIKEQDIDATVLDSFNSALEKFAQKHKNFDIFGDEYTGKDTDEFIDMLVKADSLTQKHLFEDGDEIIKAALESEDPNKAIEELKEQLPLMEARSKRNGLAIASKLKEALGSPFKTGDVAWKLKKGIPLKEGKLTEGKLDPKQIFVVYGSYGRNNGMAYVCAKTKADAKKFAQKDWLDSGRVDSVDTLEAYMLDMGFDMSMFDEFKEEEMYQPEIKNLEKIGGVVEIDWGT